MNAQLAVALSATFLNHNGTNELPVPTLHGLADTRWQGRAQILTSPTRHNLTYYLDGAHTSESAQVCADWFQSETTSNPDKNAIRILVFSCGSRKKPADLIQPLAQLNFQHVIICPSVTGTSSPLSSFNEAVWDKSQLDNWLRHIATTWQSTTNNTIPPTITHNIQETITYLNNLHPHQPLRVLVTGSLYLIGGFLSILDHHQP